MSAIMEQREEVRLGKKGSCHDRAQDDPLPRDLSFEWTAGKKGCWVIVIQHSNMFLGCCGTLEVFQLQWFRALPVHCLVAILRLNDVNGEMFLGRLSILCREASHGTRCIGSLGWHDAHHGTSETTDKAVKAC
jgi:hypothetical protein